GAEPSGRAVRLAVRRSVHPAVILDRCERTTVKTTPRQRAAMPGDHWDATGDGPPARKKPRRWRDKFREALRGVKKGVRGHSSFSVHFFFAALALAAALVLECDPVEWCLVVGCIGLVITAELFNSAVETLFHGLDPEAKART